MKKFNHIPGNGQGFRSWDSHMSLSDRMEMLGVERCDFIESCFDDSNYPDCGFWAMSAHSSEMSGLDRMISEDCYKGSEKVSHPRLQFSDGLLFWQRPEWLAKKLDIDQASAKSLIESWIAIESSTEMVLEFIRWISRRLAVKVPVWHVASERAGSYYGELTTLWDVVRYYRNLALELDAVTIKGDEFIPIQEDVFIPDYEGNFDPDMVEYLDEVDPEEREYQIPSEFKWIPMGITEGFEFDPDAEGFVRVEPVAWIDWQQMWFQELIRKTRSFNHPDGLTKFGRAVYENRTGHPKMSYDQSGVFWTQFNIQKKTLENRLSPFFHKLIEWVHSSRKPVGFIGKRLFDLQKSERLVLTNAQWEKCWAMYKDRKAQEPERAPMPEPPAWLDEAPMEL